MFAMRLARLEATKVARSAAVAAVAATLATAWSATSTSASADPALTPQPATLAGRTVRAVPCAIEGPRPDMGDRQHGGMAVTATHVYVADGQGLVRRYRPSRGKTCRLRLDRAWGTRQMPALTDGRYVLTLDADARGAVYATVPGRLPQRLDGKAAVDVCRRKGTLHASPRTAEVWRHEWGTPSRIDPASCDEGQVPMPFRVTPDTTAHLWVVGDDRIAVTAAVSDELEVWLLDGNGQQVAQLAAPDERTFDPTRIVACGDALCGLAFDRLVMWDRGGTVVGTIVAGPLLGLRGVALFELAGGEPGTFVMGKELHPDADHRGRIFRLDGLPVP